MKQGFGIGGLGLAIASAFVLLTSRDAYADGNGSHGQTLLRRRRARGIVAMALLSAVVCAAPREAWADGDQAHASSYVQRGQGVRAMAFGVGLSGRRVGAPAEPVEAAAIEVAGLPDGALVDQVYLYWVTYGEAGSSTLEVDGELVTGTAIGSSFGTCWDEYPTFRNFTYRADVTDLVTGNGSYELSAFPSGTAAADTQGASIFVVYSDPTDEASGTVLLYDGAISSIDTESCFGTFRDVNPPAETLSADLFFSVGDGELVIPDGAVQFDNTQLPKFGNQYWSSSAGTYWDVRRFDVTSLVNGDDDTIPWSASFGGDCLVFAFSALAFRSELVGGNTGGAGNSSGGADNAAGGVESTGTGGVESTGTGGAESTGTGGAESTGTGGAASSSEEPSSAGADSKPRGEGGDSGASGYAKVGDDAGCGCATQSTGSKSSLGALLLAGSALLQRLRRRRARPAGEA